MDFRLYVAPERHLVTGGTADPLDQLPPRDEPAYFGIKVSDGETQWGILLGEESLAQIGLKIVATAPIAASVVDGPAQLKEGRPPNFSEVRVL